MRMQKSCSLNDEHGMRRQVSSKSEWADKGIKSPRIKKLEIHVLQVPLKKPYVLSQATYEYSQPIIVRLFDSSGNYGIGETDPLPPLFSDGSETIADELRESLGPNLLDIGELGRCLDMLNGLAGGRFAKAAISVACYELLAKILNIPLYRLFGERLWHQIPVSWPLTATNPTEIAREARQAVKEGFMTLGVKVGAMEVARDLERIEAVVKSTPRAVRLLVDVNMGWSLDQAIEFLKSVLKLGVHSRIEFLEQPLQPHDVEGMALLQREFPLHLSVDEGLTSIADGFEVIRKNAAKVFSIKVSKLGGVLPAWEVSMLARAAGLMCYMNSMLEMGIAQAASLHLAVGMSNLCKCGHSYASTLRLDDDITDVRRWISRGFICLPDKPGLGIELDERKLERLAIKRWVLT